METTTLLTRPEAAEYLRVSVRTLDRRIRNGQIPCMSDHRGARVFFRQCDLEKYIKTSTRRR